jgi:cobalt-zinc-cadmium efflux system protein
LLRDSINLSLDAVPQDIDLQKIESYFLAISSVTEIHHLHVWGLSTTETALTVHLVVDSEKNNDLLSRINKELKSKFSIGHATIQFESISQYECEAKECK